MGSGCEEEEDEEVAVENKYFEAKGTDLQLSTSSVNNTCLCTNMFTFCVTL